MSKKKKIIIIAIVIIAIAGAAWFFMRKKSGDKFGNVLTLDNNPAEAGRNVLINGVAASGWIQPGTLSVVDGIYFGVGSDGKTYYHNGTNWDFVK